MRQNHCRMKGAFTVQVAHRPCFQSRVRIFLPAESKLAGRVRRSRGPGCGSAGSEEAGLGRLPFIRQALGCQVKYERTSSFMFDGNMHRASSTLGSMLGRSNAPIKSQFLCQFQRQHPLLVQYANCCKCFDPGCAGQHFGNGVSNYLQPVSSGD